MTSSERFFAGQGKNRRNTLCISRFFNAVRRKKVRCLGVLIFFKHALICTTKLNKNEWESSMSRRCKFRLTLGPVHIRRNAGLPVGRRAATRRHAPRGRQLLHRHLQRPHQYDVTRRHLPLRQGGDEEAEFRRAVRRAGSGEPRFPRAKNSV